MPQLHHLTEAEAKLGRQPISADDIVVMVSDALYEHLAADSGISKKQTIGRLLAIIESPLAIEIYEQEMQRRNPRDVDRWH